MPLISYSIGKIKFYTNKFLKRNPVYKKADITIESKANISHLAMVDKIIKKLKKHNILTRTTQ